MTARQALPGIEAYPELAERLEMKLARISRVSACGGCERSRVIGSFRNMLQRRIERDKGRRRM